MKDKLVKVKWLKEKSNHKVGDIIKVSKEMAEHLIKKGDCEYIIKPKEWKEEKFGRFVEKNEIIIEDISEEDILMVAGKIEKAGYNLEYWKAPKQETGHLHIKDILLPEVATVEQSNKYKELIIKKYLNKNLWDKVDWNFYNRRENAEPHRIATENEEHYKGYGIKTLLKEWGDKGANPFEEKIWITALAETAVGQKSVQQDVEDWNSFIDKVIPSWVEGKRQELSLSVGGYLRKEKRLGIEKVKSIITEICNKTKDTEIPMRLKGVDETFKKDEKDIKGFSGLPFLENENKMEKKKVITKKQLYLDGSYNRNISNVCVDISKELENKNVLFYRPNSQQIVEIGSIKLKTNDEIMYTGFRVIKDKRFITLLEKYITFGEDIETKQGNYFSIRSLSPNKSSIILESQILEESLPQIERIFQVPLPIIYNGKITFAKKGFDERFSSWRPFDSPEIDDLNMPLEKSREVINKVFSEFCFKSDQDKTNAIAALITPFFRGIYDTFNTRTPLYFYLGNRERVGKDYCAGITGILYDGQAIEDNPISSGDQKGNNNEELRKKITSTMISGRRSMHFANNKGYINNAILEQASTSSYWSDRLLGRNDLITLPNEIDYSLSGNIGVTYTPDFANRSRFINLFLDVEDANARRFNNPLLHKWIKDNRGLILSALYSLVRNWFDNGKKKGSIPFASFPNWAEVCGGIMESGGYDSPCKLDKEALSLAGDSETADMKQLFEICYNANTFQKLGKKDIQKLIEDEEIFSYYDFDKRTDQTNFGLKLRKYIGRVLSDIRMTIDDINKRPARQKYIFKKEDNFKKIDENGGKNKNNGKTFEIGGQVGNVGNVIPTVKLLGGVNSIGVAKDTKVTKLATLLSEEDFKRMEFVNN